jgi:hypothetical protein
VCVLLSYRASIIVQKIALNIKSLPDERTEAQKRIDRVKERLRKGLPVWDIVIEQTRTSVSDYKELLNSDLETIAKNYRAKIIG